MTGASASAGGSSDGFSAASSPFSSAASPSAFSSAGASVSVASSALFSSAKNKDYNIKLGKMSQFSPAFDLNIRFSCKCKYSCWIV